MLENQLNTNKTYSRQNTIILQKIEIPCDKYFLWSKVFCSQVKFTIVYYSNFSLGQFEFSTFFSDLYCHGVLRHQEKSLR